MMLIVIFLHCLFQSTMHRFAGLTSCFAIFQNIDSHEGWNQMELIKNTTNMESICKSKVGGFQNDNKAGRICKTSRVGLQQMEHTGIP